MGDRLPTQSLTDSKDNFDVTLFHVGIWYMAAFSGMQNSPQYQTLSDGHHNH